MCVKLSIIIPIYNAEKYLRKCLDSLICQSMREMEIICVNDGSKDGSLDILRKYGEKDKRVIIVNQQNGGPANARKAGYDISKGEYIALVDADDWVEKDIYSNVIDKMEAVDADIGIFNWYFNDDCKQTPCLSIDKECVIEDKEMIYKLSLSALCPKANPMIAGRHEAVPWNKVYKRNLFEQLAAKGKLFVDKMRHYDDGYFIIRIFHICEKIILINRYGYHFCNDNTESITSKYYNNLPLREDFHCYMEIGREYHFDKLYFTALNSFIINLFWLYIVKFHYFHEKNTKTFSEQMHEVHNLVRGVYTEECYFPIKEAMEDCNIKWISNRIMRFLVRYHMVSALTLYIGSRISLFRNRFFPK